MNIICLIRAVWCVVASTATVFSIARVASLGGRAKGAMDRAKKAERDMEFQQARYMKLKKLAKKNSIEISEI